MRPAEDDGPLSDSEIDALLAPFDGARLIALAVSGGPDSLALLVAAAGWAGRRGGLPRLLALTVDHRLRPGSADEAAAVAAIAARYGLAARVLTWAEPAGPGNLEDRARRARYALLLAAAAKAGASHLLTAHHRDDVAETFLMRLSRGAGLFGLAAMRPAVAAGGMTLARPLLGVPRARLAATAAAAGLTPVADPMNADPRFLRARVRAAMPLLATAGIVPAELAETAGRLAEAADAIDASATALLATAAAADALGVARLDAVAFAAAPAAVAERGLARLLMAVGGEDYPPRRAGLAALAAAIAAAAAGRPFKRTLAGVVAEGRGGAVAFYREVGRREPEGLALRPGLTAVWDGRFAVDVTTAAPGLRLGVLGEAGRRVLGLRGGAPAAALATLPAVRRDGHILLVPPLGVGEGAGEAAGIAVTALAAERLARAPLFPDLAVNAGGRSPAN